MLNPLLLWGTLLGAVPIIIHLLNRRRYRPVTWAAMEFLLEAIRKNARRLQLRDLILMALRTLAVVLLALALARPTLTGHSLLGGAKTGAVILLDNSMSMGYHNGRETRFAVAKKLSKSVVSQLEPGSWCALFTFNADVQAPLGDPTQNLAYIEQELETAAQLTDGTTNVVKALQRAQKLFESHREYKLANREVYLVTDMQAYPWRGGAEVEGFGEILKNLSATATVFLVNAGDAGVENAAVLDLTPTDTQATVDMPVTFVAKIKNFGQTDLKGLTVDFLVDPAGAEDRPQSRATVDVAAGETGSVSFDTKFSTGGDHRVAVKLADDRLAADGRRYCSLEIIDEVRVLLVDGKEQRTDDPLANETGFLRFALSPRDPENPEKQSVISTEVITPSRLGEKNLANYQAVALANVARLTPAAAMAIQRQVKAGMGLLIFLGDQVDAKAYNEVLGTSGAGLLPAALGAPWGEAPALDAEHLPPAVPLAADRDKLGHPLMADFAGPEYAELLNHVKVYRAFDLAVPNDPAVRVVAYLANGKPLLVEKKIGAGVVLLAAVPATTAWSNLPTQPTFAILMLRAAALLAVGNHPSKNLSVAAPIHCNLPLADQNTLAHVVPPPPGEKKEIRPEAGPDGHAHVDFVETDRAGFYDVVLERTPRTTLTYAVNPEAETESNLRTVTPEDLRSLYPDFRFTYVAKSEDLAGRLLGERRGSEVWPWLIALVFLMLAAESILANRWAPRD